MNRQISSAYLKDVFDDLGTFVDRAVAALRGVEFDAIAYRGNSGALVAPTLAYVLKKDLILVRKRSESSHSWKLIEGRTDPGVKYVIVDDFVASGDTLHQITDAINGEIKPAECVGVYLYLDMKRTFGEAYNDFSPYMRLRRLIGPLDELDNSNDSVESARRQAAMIERQLSLEESNHRLGCACQGGYDLGVQRTVAA